MFKPNKWELWWNNLPSSTKEYLKKQPVWHDSDMFRAAVVGFVIGILFGLLF